MDKVIAQQVDNIDLHKCACLVLITISLLCNVVTRASYTSCSAKHALPGKQQAHSALGLVLSEHQRSTNDQVNSTLGNELCLPEPPTTESANTFRLGAQQISTNEQVNSTPSNERCLPHPSSRPSKYLILHWSQMTKLLTNRHFVVSFLTCGHLTAL